MLSGLVTDVTAVTGFRKGVGAGVYTLVGVIILQRYGNSIEALSAVPKGFRYVRRQVEAVPLSLLLLLLFGREVTVMTNLV